MVDLLQPQSGTTARAKVNGPVGAWPFPKAAPAVFPLPGHRTLAQVDADQAKLADSRERDRQYRRDYRYRRASVVRAGVVDYGSPYMVRGRRA